MFGFNLNKKEKYFNSLIKDSVQDEENLYGFNSKYVHQEDRLYKMYGNCDSFNKKLKLIIITDTHNALNDEQFKTFLDAHPNYDLCLLLGDHSARDIEIILKYINKDKIYGLLGNHNFDYLEQYSIRNLNGYKITVNDVSIIGMQGSFKYKPGDFPSFSQLDSILFVDKMPKADILVTHDNRFDENMKNNPAHQGLFGITYYLYKNKVPFHIHGHLHNNYTSSLKNGTKEICVFMYQYIEL